MFCETPATSWALLFVFEASAPFIKLDHSFKVSGETSCRMPDVEPMSIGVKLSMERMGGSFQGCCRGGTLAAGVLSSLIQRSLIRWYERRRVSSSTVPF